MGRACRARGLGRCRAGVGVRAVAPEGRLNRGVASAGRVPLAGAPAGTGASPTRSIQRKLLDLLRSPRVIDVALVVGVICVALANTRWGDTHDPSMLTYVLDVALPLPLLARRRQPLPTFAVVAALGLVEWILATPADSNVAVLLGLYAVGAHAASRRAVIPAAVVAEIGVVMAALRWAPHGQELTALLLLTGTVTAAWALGIYMRTRREYLASLLDRARTAEHDRDRQALLAAAEERARIARELHDIVAHHVSVMVALSDGAAATVERDPTASRDASRQASITGRQALTEMRRLLGVLHDRSEASLNPQPGLAQIAGLLERVRTAGLRVNLVERGAPVATSATAQLAVYRVVQESLTNVLKHGRSVKTVTVQLCYSAEDVHVIIDDDGAAAVNESLVADGHGLVGMQERLAAFGGTIRAGSSSTGWRVEAHLPLQAPEDDRSTGYTSTGAAPW